MKNNELTEVKPEIPSLEGLPQEVIEYVHGLVAENAALKAFRPQPNGAAMMEALDAFFANEEYPEGAMSDAFEILCCKRVSTPATDAAIAGIKAQGVDDFASFILRDACGDRESERDVGEVIESAEEFAANLRAGRKG
ncbi:hypothetical protein QNM34_07865 [Rahnella bonaserana]|uniref:hypothetical protein n=1 Tax=Rahnella bonaserana TaxID=2816248 RepID=UPI0024C45C4F|nr:hypothetical protein [Rahnella bonaserana]WHZ42182.1 hypothetical protein QNM34_07865 [Rahnella bonaserana]